MGTVTSLVCFWSAVCLLGLLGEGCGIGFSLGLGLGLGLGFLLSSSPPPFVPPFPFLSSSAHLLPLLLLRSQINGVLGVTLLR